MKLSPAGLALIKRFEGLRLKAYRDPVGVWTIGYGHTSAAGPPKVTSGLVLSPQEAEDLLKQDLKKYEDAVLRCIKKPMNPNQFAAFVSLCYNIGPGAFERSSAARRFNEGDIDGAADAILLWNKADGRVFKGLVNRREAERKMFLNPFIETTKPEETTPVVNKPKKTIYDLIMDIFFAIFWRK